MVVVSNTLVIVAIDSKRLILEVEMPGESITRTECGEERSHPSWVDVRFVDVDKFGNQNLI